MQYVVGNIEAMDDLHSTIISYRTELIINCAGMYAWWLPDPSLFERINVNGVKNLLGAIETAR